LKPARALIFLISFFTLLKKREKVKLNFSSPSHNNRKYCTLGRRGFCSNQRDKGGAKLLTGMGKP